MDEIAIAPIGAVCVLDIETSPDPHAVALASGGRGSAQTSAALHRINDASLLFARELPNGEWVDFEMRSISSEDGGEEHLLRSLDVALQRLWRDSGVLLTWNGTAHDLAVIRRRAARHLLFDTPGILPHGQPRLLDLMLVARPSVDARWSKLRDAAAGLGIPTVCQPTGRGLGARTKGIGKSQVDVAATFVVMLYELAMARRDAGPVVMGWRAFGKYISRMGPHGDHLAQFRRHPLGGALESR